MDVAFFDETKNAYNRITEIYDLIHPIIISFANFKTEVMGFKLVFPNITEKDVTNRYKLPGVRSTMTGYLNLFMKEEVATFESKVSWLLLTNIFSIYEGWLEQLMNGPFSRVKNRDSVKNLQFPGSIKSEISSLQETETGIMRQCFLPTLQRNTHYSSTDIDDLLKCYRFFKELRNCNIHNDRKVSQNVVDAYNDFDAIRGNIIVKSTLIAPAPVLGDDYNLLLDDVIAFSNVVLDLIVVIDAQLTCSYIAEQIVLTKLRDCKNKLTLNADQIKAGDQCARMARKAGIRVYPSNRIEFMNYLKANRLAL